MDRYKMKRKAQLLLLLLFLPLAAVQAQPAAENQSAYPTSYTEADATAALEAFNKYFYSEEANLYYETTKQEELGGMYWNFDHSGKNACINYPTVIAAMRLYHITGEEQYLDKAKEIYSWARKNLFQESTGRVADHKVGNDRPGYEDYTYNQGTAIGAAVMLYKQTGEQFYLDDAIAAADYTQNEMSNNEGILPAEGDWNEQGVLKAIFVRYMDMLIEDAGQEQYLPWLQKNAVTAWNNRDKSRTLMFRDYDVPCPTSDIQSFEASSAVGFMQVIPPPGN